jgi:hypothetical protein
MTETQEWEWRQEVASDFESLDATEVHGVYALGELSCVIALKPADKSEDEDAPYWDFYMVLSQEREGFGGFEPIDSFETLELAKAYGDEMRVEMIAMVREDS